MLFVVIITPWRLTISTTVLARHLVSDFDKPGIPNSRKNSSDVYRLKNWKTKPMADDDA